MADLFAAFEFDVTTLDIEECRREFQRGMDACRHYLESKLEEWKTVPLNIAVIGNSGVGKSSFINAIRHLTADDKGGAAVGVSETTTEIRDYAHPNNPLFKLWDLPGVGTDKFPKDTYLETIQVDRYDFFLLLSATRFTENDTWLGNEITQRCKKYFFIRTKIGADMYSNRRAHPKTHNEQDVLETIRQSSIEQLARQGNESTRVFLVDSYQPQKFDFEELEQSLIRDYSKMKRQAMIMSMSAYSENMIKVKVSELRKRMWMAAMLSAVVAVAPVPGVSIIFDTGIVKSQSEFYFKQLGLDDISLQQLATLVSVDFQELKTIVNRTCGPAFLGPESLTAILELAPGGIAGSGAVTIIKEVARFIPFIGSVIAAPLSFEGTYYMLKVILDRLETVAYEVMRYTADHAIYQDEYEDA